MSETVSDDPRVHLWDENWLYSGKAHSFTSGLTKHLLSIKALTKKNIKSSSLGRKFLIAETIPFKKSMIHNRTYVLV